MSDERLLGELQEFKRAALKDLADLKGDVKALHTFKTKITTAVSVVSAVVSAITTIIVQMFK